MISVPSRAVTNIADPVTVHPPLFVKGGMGDLEALATLDDQKYLPNA